MKTLHPGYFALVMATGILSTGLDSLGHSAVSRVLFVIALVAFVVLCVLTIGRIVRYPRAIVADLYHPARAFGFFTFVAASNVLGARLVLAHHTAAAYWLLGAGLIAWIGLGYTVPWTAMLGRSERPVLQHANGTWFIWVVASESVAVLAALLEHAASEHRRELAVIAVMSWAIGIFLYGAAGIFVSARLLLYPIEPEDLTPPYWVAMGATAITVVAGARIVEMADAPMVAATRGLAAGLSVLFWAFGTWLIPMLLGAGYWRHVRCRVPVRYEPPMWSIVFPLGMYGVGGRYLGEADHLPIVRAIGSGEIYLALAVWAVTFLGMLASWMRPKGPADGPFGQRVRDSRP